MPTPFSQLLVECRSAAGFKTPHEFFKKSGAAKVLRMSFVSYWRMEKGTLLPVAERLPVLLSCLRLPVDGGKTDALLRAYLKALLRSDTAYDWLMERLAPAGAREASSLEDVAVRRLLAESYAPISREQFQAVVHDYASFWAHNLLDNDQRAWDPAELAARLGVAKRAMAKSLRVLEKAKVVAFEADGWVRSAFAGKYVRLPAADVTDPADRERVVAYRDKMAAAQGQRVFRYTGYLRAYEPELNSYFPHLQKALQAAHVYKLSGKPGEEKPGPTALFMVQGQVTRLFPF